MSNENKSAQLGLNFSTATQRLRKLIMWSLIQETGKDVCFRCGERIEDADDLSIEHKAPWQSAPDPKASFFSLDNIAFSHLRCNVGEGNRSKDRCPQGHLYSAGNTRRKNGKRICIRCDRDAGRNRWHRNGLAERRRERRMEDRLTVGQRSLKP